jgi:hypothetical protein
MFTLESLILTSHIPLGEINLAWLKRNRMVMSYPKLRSRFASSALTPNTTGVER